MYVHTFVCTYVHTQHLHKTTHNTQLSTTQDTRHKQHEQNTLTRKQEEKNNKSEKSRLTVSAPAGSSLVVSQIDALDMTARLARSTWQRTDGKGVTERWQRKSRQEEWERRQSDGGA